MAYGATVKESAANSNLIELKTYFGLEANDLTDCGTTADCKTNVKVSLTVNTTSFSKPTLCQGIFE